jgi:hypothetical protein
LLEVRVAREDLIDAEPLHGGYRCAVGKTPLLVETLTVQVEPITKHQAAEAQSSDIAAG